MENHAKQTVGDIRPEVIWGSAQGAAHKAENRPCQDAVSVKIGTIRAKPYTCCITADGHGYKSHCKSDEGASFAALAADQVLIHFLCAAEAQGKQIDPQELAKAIEKQLARLWIEQIKIARNQLDVTEYLVEYGTTILISLVYDGVLYLFQLGDGDICFFQKDGAAVFLVPPDLNPTDESTDSLCRPPESQVWHSAAIPIETVDFLMMSTDGLLKSIVDTDEYIKLGKQLDSYMEKHRPAELNARIPSWLDHYSSHGCGDDISLVAIKLKNESKGENHEPEQPEHRDGEKDSRGRTRGSLSGPSKWRKLCSKNVLRISRHPGAERYYLAPNCSRPARIDKCR